jgi:alpha-tubulin suppressor-like RCC1 family protein
MRSRLFITAVTLGVSSLATFSCDSTNGSPDGGDMDDVVQPMGDSGGDGMAGDGDTDASMDAGDPNCTVNHCATQLALGLEHACALSNDGTVRCWGLNSAGQVGVGPGGMTDSGAFDTRNTPTLVQNLGMAKQITAGYYHTCALLMDDTVWCWGDNSKGQLGAPADGGAQPPKPTPVKIAGTPMGITQIQAGGFHTCALAGGSVSCWGLNSSGQVGTGSVQPEAGVAPAIVSSPNAVSAISGATDLGLGDQFTCVSTASNVQCFGSNSFGQLGRGGDAGSPPFDPAPAAAMPLGAGTDLSKSTGSHQCAIAGGIGSCWGRNHFGQVNGTPGIAVTTPGSVMGLMMPQEIAPGGTHTCALLMGGSVQCWGGNFHGQAGQMGAGDPEAGVPMPTNVSGLTDIVSVASGWGDFSCAIQKGGIVWCWGANFEGQLGRGGNAPQYDSVPKKVIFP